MLRKILIAVVALVVLFLAFVATRPSTYEVKRSTQVAAPADIVFAQVSDFHRWDAWSPWAKLDPNVKTTFSGAAAGTGAVYDWAGNKDVGRGRMTIASAKPAQQVAIKLEFMEPFASKADTDFTFVPANGGTQVTWSMKGNLGFVEKAMGIFMNMDSMIGKDFEKGLGQLRATSEAEAAKAVQAAMERSRAEEAAKAAAAQAAAKAAADEAARQAAAKKSKGKTKR